MHININALAVIKNPSSKIKLVKCMFSNLTFKSLNVHLNL